VRARSGPFSISEIAEVLAHQRPTLSLQVSEAALRIAQGMFECFKRGEFEDHEVLVRTGFPPRFEPLADVRAGGKDWYFAPLTKIDLRMWYSSVSLAYPAAERYLKCCGFPNARIALEWLNTPALVLTSQPPPGLQPAPISQSLRSDRTTPRRKTGPVPIRRLAAETAMKEQIASGILTLEVLDKLKEEAMAERYGVSRDTARKARRNVLSELGDHELRQSSTIDK
jgi:hypothetical protein